MMTKLTSEVKYDVFLSHAGEQKWLCVDYLHEELQRVKQLSGGSDFEVFFDDASLRPGYKGWENIEKAAGECHVAVMLLTREFVRKSACMEELDMFLTRYKQNRDAASSKRDGEQLHLLPVCLGLTYDDCCNKLRTQYDTQPWVSTEDKPTDPSVLDKWAANMKKLFEFTGRRKDQAGGSKGQMASMIVDDIVQLLKDIRKLPASFQRDKPDMGPFVGTQVVKEVVGREKEVADVVLAAQKDKIVFVVGAPGEGKTHVALDAANWLYHCGRVQGGVFSVDLAGFGNAAMEDLKDFIALQMFAQHGGLTHPSMTFMSGASWDNMVAWLQLGKPGPVLLILENVEDVLDVQGDDSDSDDGEDDEGGAGGEKVRSGEAQLKDILKTLSTIQFDAEGSHQPEVGRKLPVVRRAVRVILTSRKPMSCPVHASVPEERVDIGPLAEEVAMRLVVESAGQMVKWTERLARKLAVDVCRCNALALVMIGGFMSLGRCTPEIAIERYTELDGRLKQTIERDRDRGLNTNTATQLRDDHRVHRHWIQAFLSPAELQYLSQLSVFRGSFNMKSAVLVLRSAANHPSTSATPGEDIAGDIQSVISNLGRVCVLQDVYGSSGDTRYSMHLLIRELAGDRLQLKMNTELHGCSQRAFLELMMCCGDYLAASSPYGENLAAAEAAGKRARCIIADEIANMMQVPWVLGLGVVKAQYADSGFMFRLSQLGRTLQQRGVVHAAKRILQRGAEKAEEARGQGDLMAARAAADLGMAHMVDGKPQEAVVQLRKALQVYEQSGQEGAAPVLLRRMYARALCASGGSAFQEAEVVLRGVVDVMSCTGDSDLGDALCELLTTLQVQEKRDDAAAICAMAMEVGGLSELGQFHLGAYMRAKDRGEDFVALTHSSGVSRGYSSALVGQRVEQLLLEGNAEAAVREMEKGLQDVVARFGEAHLQVAELLRVKADMYLQMHSQARKTLAAQLGRAYCGQTSPEAERMLEEAEAACRQALKIYESCMDRENTLQAAGVKFVLGKVMGRQGRGDAEREMREALQWQEDIMGVGHPSLCKQLIVLAEVLVAQVIEGWNMGTLGCSQEDEGGDETTGGGPGISCRLYEARGVLAKAVRGVKGWEAPVKAQLVKCYEMLVRQLGNFNEFESGADACGEALQGLEDAGEAGGELEGRIRSAYGFLRMSQARGAPERGEEALGYQLLAQAEFCAARELLWGAMGGGHPSVVKVALDEVHMRMKLGADEEALHELCGNILQAVLEAPGPPLQMWGRGMLYLASELNARGLQQPAKTLEMASQVIASKCGQ